MSGDISLRHAQRRRPVDARRGRGSRVRPRFRQHARRRPGCRRRPARGVPRGCADGAAAGAAAADLAAPAAVSGAAGSRTTNSLPFPRRRCAPRPCRRAARRGCARSSGRGRARPARDRAPAAPARTGRRRAAACSGAMPMPLSRTRSAISALVAPGARPRSGRRSRCTWRRWSAGSRAPAPAAPGRRRPPGSRGTSTARSCCRSSSSGLAISIALATTSASSTRSLRSSILPRAMRDTSSRSSTSRTRCWTWRSMIVRSCSSAVAAAQPHQLQRGQDRRERVAQLVAEHRQELVLGAVGRLRPRGAARASSVTSKATTDDAVDLAGRVAHRLVDEVEEASPRAAAPVARSTISRSARPTCGSPVA